MIVLMSSDSLIGGGKTALAINYSRSVLRGRRRAAAEFLAWSACRHHQRRLNASQRTQLSAHPDSLDHRNAIAQQIVWAKKHAQEKRLHESRLAQVRRDNLWN